MNVVELHITQQDINAAYAAQGPWGMDSEFTPAAVALRRLCLASAARVGYTRASLDGLSLPVTGELRQHVLEFGYSLSGALTADALRAIKELHKTNSSHATEVKAPPVQGLVKPCTVKLPPEWSGDRG